MKVDEVSINQVFLTNRTLKIPYFQRPYVWTKPNWEKFYNDVAEIAIAINEGDEPETTSFYYCSVYEGSLPKSWQK